MLTIEALEVCYGVIPAIKDMSIQVNEGEIVTLIGANGAGKTTTLKTISGLVKPANGRVFFNNVDITGKPAHEIVALGLLHAPEGRGVFANLTVMENLMLGAYLRKDKDKAKEEELSMVFERFPRLKERVKQMAGTLSGGEQQMLAIARSLMGKPKLLLLDEPSMGLAPILVKEIFKIIKDINEKYGTTILLVEQNAHLALKVAHRGYVLETGEIVAEGKGSDLLNDPEIRKAYLGY
ncbi:ABC transporter ATP-binding protein [Petroclostridium sp. X23]|uniref:ABC transporter ATP-binding protein n=1 Tax=Petroclostridium sp. X23 TaxID=3045146 RepID=UPI0024AE135D|nr:ABC transporter ATP-binding protein [Petroclostridium sp. X23]WHH61474.1 ABC transporter ATP-binding protein [Petroclostridium sp. X23]